MKIIYTKWKLCGTLCAVTIVLTLAIFPSCSWAFLQQVWYSNGWQTVIVGLIQIFQKVCLGSFQAKGLSLYLACIYAMQSVHKMSGALPSDESYVTPVQSWMSVGRQTKELQIVNVGKCAWCCTLQPLAPTSWIISYH